MARLMLYFSLFALFSWSIVIAISWNYDSRHTRVLFDTHMELFAKSLAELDLEHLHGEVDEIEELLPHKRKKKRLKIENFFSFTVFSASGQRMLSDDEDGKHLPFAQKIGFSGAEIDDDDWRLFTYITKDNAYVIVVGQEMEFRQEFIFKVLWRHLLPWMIMLPLFLCVLCWFLHKELRPLRELAQCIQGREASDIKPLMVHNLSTETRPVVIALNNLFERITALLHNERAFVSNAAHELRTPLAGLRVQAEVLEMCIDDAKSRENALQKILEGCTRCTHLVEQLLLLSSLEAKAVTRSQESIPWRILVQDAQDTVQWAAEAKQVRVQAHMQADPILKEGHGELWAIVLRNLLDNAVRYSACEGKVQVLLQTRELVVENIAPHIPQEALSQLGQRFYRPPGQKERGSGLGLAMVRHIAGLHGARLSIENSMLDGQESVKVSIVF